MARRSLTAIVSAFGLAYGAAAHAQGHDADAHIQSYCEYLELEGGNEDLLDTMAVRARFLFQRGYSAAAVNERLKANQTRIEQIPGEHVCMFEIWTNSTLCSSVYGRSIDFSEIQLDIDGDGWGEDLRFNARLFPGVPRSNDRVYLSGMHDTYRAIGPEDQAIEVSERAIIVEMPRTNGCYFPTVADVNDDNISDLVIIDPKRTTGQSMDLGVARLCGNGNGQYDRKFCKPKAAKPPHLRIRHPHE